jgi:hypothetical protein
VRSTALKSKLHCPTELDWHRRFGLSKEATPREAVPNGEPVVIAAPGSKTPARLVERNCAGCGKPVSFGEAQFCSANRSRFRRKLYCRACQRIQTTPPKLPTKHDKRLRAP